MRWPQHTSPRMPYLHLLTVQCERCANRVSAAAVFDIVTERKARCQHHKSCKRRKKHSFRCELFFLFPTRASVPSSTWTGPRLNFNSKGGHVQALPGSCWNHYRRAQRSSWKLTYIFRLNLEVDMTTNCHDYPLLLPNTDWHWALQRKATRAYSPVLPS